MFNCPDEQQPRIELAEFDVASDAAELEFRALFGEVDLARTKYDVAPEGVEAQITDPTITPYPMPDHSPGFFMGRVDGEGAVIQKRFPQHDALAKFGFATGIRTLNLSPLRRRPDDHGDADINWKIGLRYIRRGYMPLKT